MDKSALGKRISRFRNQANMTSEKLAELCECSSGTIRKIESGARLPSVPAFINLCNALKVSPNDLLGAEMTYKFDATLEESTNETQQARLTAILLRVQRLSPERFETICTTIETLLSGLDRL
jgi:transcriptional regulator with XRE-family HTH domain